MLASLANSNVPGIQAFRSTSADVVHEHLSRRLSHHRFDCAQTTRMDARVYSLELGAIQLVDLQYGTEVDVNAHVDEDHFLVHLVLDGETVMWGDGERYVLRPDELLISSAETSLRVHMTSHCRHLAVRMPVSVCTDYLSQQLHIPVQQSLAFYPGSNGSRELPTVWRSMLAHIGQQQRLVPTMMGNRRVQKAYGTLLAELLLGNYANSYSEQIALHGNNIAPRHVRKARDIIHNSLEETISIAVLAQSVGVSVRSLQNGFRHFLGVTPLEYIRRHRLEKLHAALMGGQGGANVTDFMLECGIVNFGRYAQYYRQQYGCLPSETLKRRH